jgi:hypothetical protein
MSRPSQERRGMPPCLLFVDVGSRWVHTIEVIGGRCDGGDVGEREAFYHHRRWHCTYTGTFYAIRDEKPIHLYL